VDVAVVLRVEIQLESKAHDEDGVVVGTRSGSVNGDSPVLDAGGS
jgi:hypothetical protein